MKQMLIGAALAAGLYAAHRFALYAEGRGWIYYTKAGRSSGSLGNAFLEIQSVIEPSKRHVVEERRRQAPEQDAADDPPPERN